MMHILNGTKSVLNTDNYHKPDGLRDKSFIKFETSWWDKRIQIERTIQMTILE